MNPNSFLSVLYVGVGTLPWRDEQLSAYGIGIVAVDTPARAHRLLSQFRVAAVVFATPDLRALRRLASDETPIVLLQDADPEWEMENIALLARNADARTLARTIRRLAAPLPAGTAAPIAA